MRTESSGQIPALSSVFIDVTNECLFQALRQFVHDLDRPLHVVKGSGMRMGPYDVLIVDEPRLLDLHGESQPDHSSIPPLDRTVLVLEEHPTQNAESALLNQRVYHVCSAPTVNGAPVIEVLLRRLAGKCGSPMESFFEATAAQEAWILQRAQDRFDAMDRVDQFLEGVQLNRRLLQNVLLCVDEMLTNAFFNAPIGVDGNSLYSGQHRSDDIDLPAHKPVHLRALYSEEYVGVVVKDHYGSLSAETVAGYLSKTMADHRIDFDARSGGAGLGLVFMAQCASHLIFDLVPSQSTEVCALFRRTKRYKNFLESTRSIDIFEAPSS